MMKTKLFTLVFAVLVLGACKKGHSVNSIKLAN